MQNNKHDKCFRDILIDKDEIISLLKDKELMENLEKIIKNINEKEQFFKLRNIAKYILKGILEEENIEKIEKMIEAKEENYSMDELIERIKRNDKKKIEKIAQDAMKTGISQGMEKAITNMVKKLINLDIPLEQIIQVTGLTEEKIKSMK